jgi:tetratricopeptide (TPR) repeat protein
LDESKIHEREPETASLSAQQTKATKKQELSEQRDLLADLAHTRHRALTCVQAKDWEQAFPLLMEIVGADEQDSEALLCLAATLDALNNFELLYDIAQRIIVLEPNSAQGLAYKARALQKLNRISEAKIANDQALLLNTHLGLAWINRSGLQLLQEKFADALRSAQRAIDLAASDARAWANYGVALFNFNRLGEALEAFDKSLEHDPYQLFALQMKGDILCRIGRMRELIPLLQRARTIQPQDIRTLTLGIQAFRSLEMFEELKECCLKLIGITPKDPFVWENYVRGRRGLGQFAEAIDALDYLIELDNSNVRFITIKADTLYRLERYREAVTIAEHAMRLNQDYPPARRIYEKSLRMMYQRKEKKKV